MPVQRPSWRLFLVVYEKHDNQWDKTVISRDLVKYMDIKDRC